MARRLTCSRSDSMRVVAYTTRMPGCARGAWRSRSRRPCDALLPSTPDRGLEEPDEMIGDLLVPGPPGPFLQRDAVRAPQVRLELRHLPACELAVVHVQVRLAVEAE